MISSTSVSSTRKPISGLSWMPFILLIFSLDYVHAILYKQHIYDSDLADIFGSLDCIEGTLAMAPAVTVHMPSSNVQDSQVSSSEHHDTTTKISMEDVNENMAKEKTPMCLVNELARYNKIEHQYRLTSEEGPPHKKRFTVTLKLGTEEYTAEGPSIKKAQHSAAGIALTETQYKHPPPKSLRNSRPGKGNITPTVELNALAMKRGEPTVYTVVELPSVPPLYNYNYRHRGGMYTQRYPGGGGIGVSEGYKVTVSVGEREFIGEGTTAQAARHDAASKALRILKDLPVDNTNQPANHLVQNQCERSVVDADSSSELKSPISLVHEIALKRNLPVTFEVLSEKGPPHMRTFVTKCTVGDKFEANGEGNGKKVSKKRAAERILELLRTLPPMTNVTNGCSMTKVKRKSSQAKKKPRNLIKETNVVQNSQEQKFESDSGADMNPISRLIQIQQAKREKEPIYTLKDEKGSLRRREFHMEVTVGDHSYVGTGPNKKIAKRNAADGMLQLLGFSSPVLNSQGVVQNKFSMGSKDPPVGGVSGRQLVPGLFLMNNDKKAPSSPGQNPTVSKSGVSIKATASIAKEYLSSHAASQSGGSDQDAMGDRPAIRPTEQLNYLSQVLNFKVQYADFPKGNHNEFLSLVTLSTDPPQVCHGAGPNIELSKDQAALSALRSLAEMGLDSITQKKSEPPSPHPLGNSTLPSNPNGNNEIYMGLGNSISKADTNFVNGQ